MTTLIKHIDYCSLLVGRKGSQRLAWKIFLILKNYIQTIINILTIDFLHNIFKEKNAMQCNGLKSPPLPLSTQRSRVWSFFSNFHFFHLWIKWMKKNIVPWQLLQANCPCWETTSLGRTRFGIFNQIALLICFLEASFH
jgi:hypothetical protein